MTISMENPSLIQDLRKLNLSGIIDSLPERNQEAVTNQMTYLEFLSLLAQDERCEAWIGEADAE